MKKFQFSVEITEAVGSQVFEIRANSAEEALALIKRGGGQIVESDVEVQGLAWNTATLIDEVDLSKG